MPNAGVASSTDAAGLEDEHIGAVLTGDLDGRVRAGVGDDGQGRRHSRAIEKVGNGDADRHQAPPDQRGLVVGRDDHVHGERRRNRHVSTSGQAVSAHSTSASKSRSE